jgi:hypothetical protein
MQLPASDRAIACYPVQELPRQISLPDNGRTIADRV